MGRFVRATRANRRCCAIMTRCCDILTPSRIHTRSEILTTNVRLRVYVCVCVCVCVCALMRELSMSCSARLSREEMCSGKSWLPLHPIRVSRRLMYEYLRQDRSNLHDYDDDGRNTCIHSLCLVLSRTHTFSRSVRVSLCAVSKKLTVLQ